jgi:hypothetical protein
LTKVFSENNLRDEWMIATLVLLDRLAQKKCTTSMVNRTSKAFSCSISKAQPDDCAEVHVEWLAAMLCVFKLSSVEAELDIGLKDLIYRLGKIPRLSSHVWDLIVKAEWEILRMLDFCIAVPCPAHLAGRIVLDVVVAVQRNQANWPGIFAEQLPAPKSELASPMSRFSLLVTFLVELGLTDSYEHVYKHGVPPIALALAAVHLAIHAFGEAPPAGIEKLEAAKRDTLSAQEVSDLLPPLVSALYRAWGTRTMACIENKWRDREKNFTYGPLPLASALAAGQGEPPLKTPERMPRRLLPSPPTTGPRRKILPGAKLGGPVASTAGGSAASSAVVKSVRKESEAQDAKHCEQSACQEGLLQCAEHTECQPHSHYLLRKWEGTWDVCSGRPLQVIGKVVVRASGEKCTIQLKKRQWITEPFRIEAAEGSKAKVILKDNSTYFELTTTSKLNGTLESVKWIRDKSSKEITWVRTEVGEGRHLSEICTQNFDGHSYRPKRKRSRSTVPAGSGKKRVPCLKVGKENKENSIALSTIPSRGSIPRQQDAARGVSSSSEKLLHLCRRV